MRARVERALQGATLPTGRVTVAVPDATRPLDLELILPPLLERLPSPVTLYVALGLHRPMTPHELLGLHRVARMYGAHVEDHASDACLEVSPDVGLFPGGKLPAWFGRAVVEADALVCVGLVEPHQYAGFSGGVKTVSIGCAGAETISAMHGLAYLRDPRTTLGVVEGNPFREALGRLAAPLAPMYALQVVPTPVPQVFWGAVDDAFSRAVEVASEGLFEEHTRTYPWVHVPVPAAKATNVYQASRAATYVSLVEGSVVEPGGWILVEATCEEAMGQGSGEVACARALARGADALLAELYGSGTRALRGGEQRAYVIAKALERHRIAWIGAPAIPELSSLGVPQFATLAEAVSGLGLGATHGITLSDVFHAVPRMK